MGKATTGHLALSNLFPCHLLQFKNFHRLHIPFHLSSTTLIINKFYLLSTNLIFPHLTFNSFCLIYSFLPKLHFNSCLLTDFGKQLILCTSLTHKELRSSRLRVATCPQYSPQFLRGITLQALWLLGIMTVLFTFLSIKHTNLIVLS